MTQNSTNHRPIAVAPERDGRRVLLKFPKDGVAPSGRYYFCGGLAWPCAKPERQSAGFAVLCGRDERTGRIYVFEQQGFMIVNWLRRLEDDPAEQMETEYPALAPFLSVCWSNYLARMFCWREEEIAQDFYVKQAMTAHDPYPILPTVLPMDHDQAIARVFMEDAAMKLAYEPGSAVHDAIAQYESAQAVSPAMSALVSAIYGMSLVKPL